MLYLVSTPIGNLSDITYRAVETLKNCDYILCEDTRHSRILFERYQITSPRYSYHKFNERAKLKQVISDLQAGKHIALISDAGTPGISDPGERLVEACHDENITVSSIPGPCAAIAALTCSGLPTEPFQFIGFVTKKILEKLNYPGTTICYTPARDLKKILSMLASQSPNRMITVARELTKRHEEIIKATATEQVLNWQNRTVRGEIVLVLKGEECHSIFTSSIEEHVTLIQKLEGLPKKEAIKKVAKLRNIPKREVYKHFIN